MYCSQCGVNWDGWNYKCPDCRMILVDQPSPVSRREDESISYQSLVELVRNKDKRISVPLNVREVERLNKWGFPFCGFGYAWAKRMNGFSDSLYVNLTTTETGRQHTRRFPYFGFGFAWEKTMQGNVAGNPISLTVTEVGRQLKWSFLWLGYGYAWAEVLSGECGPSLKAKLTTSGVGRKKEWSFPYRGYGYAWIKSADLELWVIE